MKKQLSSNTLKDFQKAWLITTENMLKYYKHAQPHGNQMYLINIIESPAKFSLSRKMASKL